MTTLLRKFCSFFSYAGTPSRLAPAIWRNIALARAWTNRRGSFVYDSPVGIRFVCFADNATSLQLFVHGYQEVAEIEVARAWLKSGDRCILLGKSCHSLFVLSC